ncbi:unnamed protein product, partial [Mesorhabditis belari]|uniref:3'-5' exonuclease domain-containing protein n=1 Tax=Mesorhabditis belari TaxID=2138241 RepID=A0AAF3FGK1_9BILA
MERAGIMMDEISKAHRKEIVQHHDYRSFMGITCLIQISTRDADFLIDLIDPFLLWSELHILNEPFSDPKILKVFHGADKDIVWLQRDFGIYVVNMFDTGRAARHLGLPKHSLQYLVDSLCQDYIENFDKSTTAAKRARYILQIPKRTLKENIKRPEPRLPEKRASLPLKIMQVNPQPMQVAPRRATCIAEIDSIMECFGRATTNMVGSDGSRIPEEMIARRIWSIGTSCSVFVEPMSKQSFVLKSYLLFPI